MQLNNSGVVFNEDNHTYFLGEKQLFGITGMLGRQLFPDKYASIPKHIMDNAAQRGSMIHSACELIDDLGIEHDSNEGRNYLAIKEQYKLDYLCSEYLVTDSEYFATAIDKVYKASESSVILGDIKTTYKLDKEYLSWQLSINAYLFELQNPHLKVAELYGIWLKGEKCAFEPIQRKPDDEVIRLLESEKKGLVFTEKKTEIADFKDAEQSIADIEMQIKELTDRKKVLSDGLLKLMQKHNVDSWKGEKVSLTRKKAYIRETVDGKLLKSQAPEIYRAFVKESKVNESITIKVL